MDASWAVAVFVDGIFESVPGVVIDLDVNFLPELLHGLLKLVHIVGSDATVLPAKQAQDRRVDFLQRVPICGKAAIIDDVGGKRGLLQRDLERIASAHAPTPANFVPFLPRIAPAPPRRGKIRAANGKKAVCVSRRRPVSHGSRVQGIQGHPLTHLGYRVGR